MHQIDVYSACMLLLQACMQITHKHLAHNNVIPASLQQKYIHWRLIADCATGMTKIHDLAAANTPDHTPNAGLEYSPGLPFSLLQCAPRPSCAMCPVQAWQQNDLGRDTLPHNCLGASQ